MKNWVLFFLALLPVWGAAQKGYWQQKVDITIEVALNDTNKTLDGFEKVVYTNHSPDTLTYIWFHLWPNAYKNDKTAFSDQRLLSGKTDFYFSTKEQRGYINRLDFKVNGSTAKTEDHPQHIDIVKVILPEPLAPGKKISITTPFHVKLPYLFSRSGYVKGTFQVTQWYPKPAVYDAQGWHPIPYLEQGEFYSEFGDYDVTITLPQDYVVAATGVLQNGEELDWLRTRRHVPAKNEKPQAMPRRYGHLKKLPETKKDSGEDSNFFKQPSKLLRFLASNVHDFAWMASKQFQVDQDTCRLPSGKLVNVYTYFAARPHTAWEKSLQYAKDALRFYSSQVGEYPYATLHVAESAVADVTGMEYPTLTIITPTTSAKKLDILIAHEVGHNWFYGALATNERTAPWLDEGLNSFYEQQYTAQKYGASALIDALVFHTLAKQKKDQPIATPAPLFTDLNYGLVAYGKAAAWVGLLKQYMGSESFQKCIQAYYKQWQFKHPQDTDLKKILASALPDTSAFRLLYANGTLPNQQLSGFTILSPLLPGTFKKFLQHPSANRLLIAPAAGYNSYDKLMIGALLTNYGLPPKALQFVAVPLYASGSNNWNGLGELKYSRYYKGRFRKIEAALSGMAFSKRFLPDSNGAALHERFLKIAPSLRLTFNEPIQSTRERWLEWKTVGVQEQNFSRFVTKLSDGLTYVDSIARSSYYVNQATYRVTNYRVLYPYHYQLQVQQGQTFYRINLSGDYFFNYPTSGGAGVRLFFAKFGYLTQNNAARYATVRFQPKLLGNTGEEDYMYSSYFLGRTASYAADASVVRNNGVAAQQILLRDGALKLRLDQFDFLQGRSDNWVAALNFTTTVPKQLLPAQIPLKLFLDIGTYAGANKEETETGRILYVGGVQLSLLKNAITLYAPLVYSSVFRDNLKTLPEQNTFLRRLTFSLDFGALSLQRITRNKFSL